MNVSTLKHDNYIDDYKILNLIYKTADVKIYKAIKNNKLYAIKVFNNVFVKHNKSFTKIFECRAKFLKSFKHENIVQLIDYKISKNENLYYLVFEYLNGITLSEALKLTKFNLKTALYIIQNIIMPLHYINTKFNINFLHNDISPENVFITKDGGIKIIDFDSSYITFINYMPFKPNLEGKLFFIAPEKLLKRKFTIKSEIFSIGAILYKLLTKKNIISNNNIKTLKDLYEFYKNNKLQLNLNFDNEKLNYILQRSLSYDEKIRFSNLEEFLENVIELLYQLDPKYSKEKFYNFIKSNIFKMVDNKPKENKVQKTLIYTTKTNIINHEIKTKKAHFERIIIKSDKNTVHKQSYNKSLFSGLKELLLYMLIGLLGIYIYNFESSYKIRKFNITKSLSLIKNEKIFLEYINNLELSKTINALIDIVDI